MQEPTPWRWRMVASVAALAVVAVAPLAGAQSSPPLPPDPPTTPTTSAPPVTQPPVTQPPSTVPPATPVPVGPPTPGSPADPAPLPPAPPIEDGAEIPDPVPGAVPVPGSFGPAVGVPMSPSAQRSFDAARAAISEQIAERGDALAVAREIESSLTAELAAADAAMADAQAELDRALDEQSEAKAAADTARAEAKEALAAARDAHRELRDIAVIMYIDPPQQFQIVAELTGGMEERMAAQSMLAVKADLSQEAAAKTAAADRRAERSAKAAVDAAAKAERRTADAQRQSEDLSTQVESRQASVDAATLRTAALMAEVGALAQLNPSLESRLAMQAAISSGTVQVSVNADGTWSVATVGFPGAGDIMRILGTTITVHRLIADQVAAMINAAAAEGVFLDGWGYRDTTRQIELRREHCGGDAAAVFSAPSSSCSPPTARPGRSMHERGLAIDFKNCSARSTACFQWLSRNAARYGLFNLPSEPWHWSTNGN